jgi:heptosyltransferase-2/heptosyltransferase-3
MDLEALAARNRIRTEAKNRPSLRQQVRLALLRLYANSIAAPRADSPDLPGDARILVIRPDHLGDVLFITPALGQLRGALPDAHITAMVGPWATRVLQGNPDVDKVLSCPFPGFTRQANRTGYSVTMRKS